mmetsp:Transcript_60975/g.176497  ORF Transcript_60975/g.176497 Transcript_60975/m.176497 type:complete len:206 (-) Transcript_60975:52-669(-)
MVRAVEHVAIAKRKARFARLLVRAVQAARPLWIPAVSAGAPPAATHALLALEVVCGARRATIYLRELSEVVPSAGLLPIATRDRWLATPEAARRVVVVAAIAFACGAVPNVRIGPAMVLIVRLARRAATRNHREVLVTLCALAVAASLRALVKRHGGATRNSARRHLWRRRIWQAHLGHCDNGNGDPRWKQKGLQASKRGEPPDG